MGCGEESPADTSVYIGIFNSKVNSSILSGAGVLDIYNSCVVGKGQIYESASIGGYEGCSTMGDINIYNSYIKATSQGDGAVIGSAKNCTGGNIKIVNSTVDAQSTKDNVYGSGTGAAIGSGAGGTGGNIVIENSYIIASGVKGAGIGGGDDGNGGTINITDSEVYAKGKSYGVGIGCGEDGESTTVRICGSSKVKAEAKAGSMSSAVGHGGYWFSYDGNSTYIDEGLLVKAGEKESSAKDYSYKDRVKAAENNNYAYIYPCAFRDRMALHQRG